MPKHSPPILLSLALRKPFLSHVPPSCAGASSSSSTLFPVLSFPSLFALCHFPSASSCFSLSLSLSLSHDGFPLRDLLPSSSSSPSRAHAHLKGRKRFPLFLSYFLSLSPLLLLLPPLPTHVCLHKGELLLTLLPTRVCVRGRRKDSSSFFSSLLLLSLSRATEIFCGALALSRLFCMHVYEREKSFLPLLPRSRTHTINVSRYSPLDHRFRACGGEKRSLSNVSLLLSFQLALSPTPSLFALSLSSIIFYIAGLPPRHFSPSTGLERVDRRNLRRENYINDLDCSTL